MQQQVTQLMTDAEALAISRVSPSAYDNGTPIGVPWPKRGGVMRFHTRCCSDNQDSSSFHGADEMWDGICWPNPHDIPGLRRQLLNVLGIDRLSVGDRLDEYGGKFQSLLEAQCTLQRLSRESD